MLESPNQNPEKILLVRVGLGGDLIMITPAVDALLSAYPDAEFHLLTTGQGRRTMSGFSDRITKTFLYSRRFPQRLFLERDLSRQFQAENYSQIFIFESKPHYSKWLKSLAPRVHVVAGSSETCHYCRTCLDIVAAATGESVSSNWVRLPVTKEGQEKARQLLTENRVDPGAKLVGLHPTFSGTRLPFFRNRHGSKHRMWPGQSFAQLAKLLKDQAQGQELTLVIDALPEEAKFVQPIVDSSEGAITLLAAPPDFQRYKGLLSLLDLLITPNTGPMHMAAALDTPVVALFSNWSPKDCGPYMEPERYRVLRAEETAHPERGLAAIEPEIVAESAIRLLKDTSP